MAIRTRLNGKALQDRLTALTDAFERDVDTVLDAAEVREAVVDDRLADLEAEKSQLGRVKQAAAALLS